MANDATEKPTNGAIQYGIKYFFVYDVPKQKSIAVLTQY